MTNKIARPAHTSKAIPCSSLHSNGEVRGMHGMARRWRFGFLLRVDCVTTTEYRYVRI